MSCFINLVNTIGIITKKTKSNSAEHCSKHVISINSLNGKGAINVHIKKPRHMTYKLKSRFNRKSSSSIVCAHMYSDILPLHKHLFSAEPSNTVNFSYS